MPRDRVRLTYNEVLSLVRCRCVNCDTTSLLRQKLIQPPASFTRRSFYLFVSLSDQLHAPCGDSWSRDITLKWLAYEDQARPCPSHQVGLLNMDLLKHLITPATATLRGTVNLERLALRNDLSALIPRHEREGVHPLDNSGSHLKTDQRDPYLLQDLTQKIEDARAGSENETIDIAVMRSEVSAIGQSVLTAEAFQFPQQIFKQQQQHENKKICFFWYHFGSCDRDPTCAKKPGKSCPCLHGLGNGQTESDLQRVPRWMHKRPCGLALCPLRDTTWQRPDGTKTEKKAKGASSKGKEQASRTVKKEAQPTTPKKTKRKYPIRHPDDPTPSVSKRHKIDYDEMSESLSEGRDNNETCFFWYHGRCSRALDVRNNYQCDFRHALTDPPTMVQPPPGYVHKKPCGLEWCPGDAAEACDTSKRYFKGIEDRSTKCGIVSEKSEADEALLEQDGESCEASDNGEDWYLSGFEEGS